MKKESFTSFMKQVAADLQQSGNLGTAHVYRSSLNAILVFQESESVEFREITPEWLKHFEDIKIYIHKFTKIKTKTFMLFIKYIFIYLCGF